MSINDCSKNELDIIKKCLLVCFDEEIFPDYIFHTIFGIDRKVYSILIHQFPEIDLRNASMRLAVMNSINNILGCPHKKSEIIEKSINCNKIELKEIRRKLKI